MTHGDVTQDLSNTVGAAFVTAVWSISRRGKGPMNKSDSDNDDIPNDNCWGKFMVMSILVHRRSLMNLHSVHRK